MERRRSKNRGLRGKKTNYENITAGVQDHTQVPAATVLESAPVAQPNVEFADACSASSADSFPELSRVEQEEGVKRSCRPHDVAGPSDWPDPKRRFPDQHALSTLHQSSITTLYMASDSSANPNAQPQLALSAGPIDMQENPEGGRRDEDQAHNDDDDDDDEDEVVIRKGWGGAVRRKNEQRGVLTPPRDQRGQKPQQQHHHQYYLHHHQQQLQQQHHHPQEHLYQQQQEHRHPHQQEQQQEQNHQQQQQELQLQEQNHQQQQQEQQLQEQNHQQQQQQEQQLQGQNHQQQLQDLHQQQPQQQQKLKQNSHHQLQLQQQQQEQDQEKQQQRYHLSQVQHQQPLQYHLHQPQHPFQCMSQHPHLQHCQHQQQQQQRPHLLQRQQHQHQQRQQNPHQQEEHERQHQHCQRQQQAVKSRPPRDKAARQSQQTQQAACEQAVFLPPQSPVGILGTQSDSAISGQEITSEQRLFYGANIGSETRNVEFKRGGGEYLRSTFRSHLRRYACAFLNSGGGMLLAGVDDEGVVRGLRCDHRQEDRARLLVDSTLKFFQPPLLPHCYSLSFLPVVRPGPEGLNLKVLRLVLQPPPAHTQLALYQTDLGEVFMRRDGSVEGPLSASAIQEWARQRWSGEVIRLQHCIQVLLTEQRLLLQEVRQQSLTIATLQQARMPPGAPASPPTPTAPIQAAPPPAAPRLEGLRDRLLKGKLSRRLNPAQTSPQSLSGCPSLSNAPILVPTTPAGSQDHLTAVMVSGAEGGLSAAPERDSWMPQGCEGMWGDVEECQREAGVEPAGIQTPVSAACIIM